MARTNTFETFDNILPRYIRNIAGKKKYSEQVVFFYWEKIIGDDVAKHVRPDYFSFRTLFLAADSPVWANQLMFMREEIKEKINSFVGENLIKEIRFNASVEAMKREIPQKETAVKRKRKTSLPESEDIKKAVKACVNIKDNEIKKAAEKALSVSLALNRDRISDGWHKCKDCGCLCTPEDDYCEKCIRKNKRETEKKIRELLEARPWSSYGEIYNYVPCTALQANSQRALMVQRFAGKLLYGDFESIDTKNFVMLVDCVPPEELTDERIKRVMKRYRWMFAKNDSKN